MKDFDGYLIIITILLIIKRNHWWRQTALINRWRAPLDQLRFKYTMAMC